MLQQPIGPNKPLESADNFILKALKACRALFWTAFGFSFFINLLLLLVPLYSLQVLDRVLSSGSMDTLMMLTLVVGGALIFVGFLQGLRGLIFSHMSRWLDDELSLDLVGKTMHWVLYKPHLGSQGLRDLATLRQFVSSPALISMLDGPWAILFFIVIFMIHTTLGLVVVGGALVLLILSLSVQLIPSANKEKAQGEQMKAMQNMEAMFRNAEVISAMGLIEGATRRWRGHNGEAQEKSFVATNFTVIMTNITRVLRLFLQVLLTGLGGYFTLQGDMTAGGMIAVSILAGKALAPFDQMVNMYQGWTGARGAYNRLIQLELPRTIDEKTQLPEPQGEIRIEKLSYQEPISKKWLLRGVNIAIKPGESIGIIGPSGSGKTTLARALVNVLQPTSGQVCLDKAALHQWNREILGRYIGYLPQDIELFSGTVAENIARLDQVHNDEGIVRAAQMAEVHEFILSMSDGYQTDIGLNGRSLSAGQRQRIALARAFYGTPKYVVLDEPNANLDTDGEIALVKALQNAQSEGITMFVIAHRPSVMRFVDHILVMGEGEAKVFGERDEVLAQLQKNAKDATPNITPNIKPLAPAG